LGRGRVGEAASPPPQLSLKQLNSPFPELAEGHSQNLSFVIKEKIVFPFSKAKQFRDV
jgi:hypothetical protein